MDLFCIVIAVIDLIYEHSSTVPFTNVCNINKTERKKKKEYYLKYVWLEVNSSIFYVDSCVSKFISFILSEQLVKMERLSQRNPSTQVVKLYGNSRPRKDPLWLPFPVDRTTWGR